MDVYDEVLVLEFYFSFYKSVESILLINFMFFSWDFFPSSLLSFEILWRILVKGCLEASRKFWDSDVDLCFRAWKNVVLAT